MNSESTSKVRLLSRAFLTVAALVVSSAGIVSHADQPRVGTATMTGLDDGTFGRSAGGASIHLIEVRQGGDVLVLVVIVERA